MSARPDQVVRLDHGRLYARLWTVNAVRSDPYPHPCAVHRVSASVVIAAVAGDGQLPDWCVEAGLTAEQYRQSLRTPPDFGSVEAVDRWMTPAQAAELVPMLVAMRKDGVYYDMQRAVFKRIVQLAKRADRPPVYRGATHISPRSRRVRASRRRTPARPDDEPPDLDPDRRASA